MRAPSFTGVHRGHRMGVHAGLPQPWQPDHEGRAVAMRRLEVAAHALHPAALEIVPAGQTTVFTTLGRVVVLPDWLNQGLGPGEDVVFVGRGSSAWVMGEAAWTAWMDRFRTRLGQIDARFSWM